MQRALLEELDYPGDGLYYQGTEPFTGIVYSGFKDEPDSEEEYRNGMPWGEGRSWHNSGALAAAWQSAGGAYHGLLQEWYEDGRLALLEVYEHGVCLHRKRWDEAGKRLEKFELKASDSNFRILRSFRRAFWRERAQKRE